ncbi:MAG: MBOAT family protein [Muribaculaceae bacterium]|nr:MBOAT family protein [Muribaculaceae bacterium]
MQFDSYIYAFFLPLVFAGYWILRNKLTWQNLFLLVASYIFYGWWDWRFLALILITSTTTFISGLAIKSDHSLRSKLWLALNLIINLGILGTFKYFNFFKDALADIFRLFGANPDFVTINILLPVGISFYTLQAISYSFDVYNGKTKPTNNVIAFFVYIAFFPQLVAGPIERARNLLPQFLTKKSFNYYNAVIGMRQILWGLVKKLVIADNLAGYVDNILYNPSVMSAASIIMAAILFAFQIYSDFSGYSDIAIGSARLFNIKLLPNFNYPFFSRSMKELWQRWHISLMTWFREYLYFPLGGSRCGKWRTCLNIMIVFAVSGLWHGADWTFVIWGSVNGLMLLPFVFLKKQNNTRHARFRDIPLCVLTFMIFALIFLSFRSPNISHLQECINTLIHGSYLAMPMGISAFCYIVPFVIVEWIGRRQEFPIMTLKMPAILRWAIYWGMLFLIAFYGAKADIQYIYFQF